MVKTHVVNNSRSSKLMSSIPGKQDKRPISSTSRTSDTCAPDCPFMYKGEHGDQDGVPICYPNEKHGRPSIFQMADQHGIPSTQSALDKIQYGAAYKSAVRHLVAGDVASPNDDYIEAANNLHAMRKDLQGWGYTHHWRSLDPTQAQGWVLNASTETPAQATEALSRGWQAVIESPSDNLLHGTRIAGRKVVQCPNQTSGIGCADCHLCRSNSPTRPIVEFEIHGTNKKKVTNVVLGIRRGDEIKPVDVDPAPNGTRRGDFQDGFTDRG